LLFTTFVVAVPGAGYLSYTYIVKGMYHLAWIPALAIILTIFFYIDFFKKKNSITARDIEVATQAEEAE
jgi:hypothetical protein